MILQFQSKLAALPGRISEKRYPGIPDLTQENDSPGLSIKRSDCHSETKRKRDFSVRPFIENSGKGGALLSVPFSVPTSSTANLLK